MRNSLLLLLLSGTFIANGQLTIQSGATFFVQPGATVTVQGDLTSSSNITGGGIILLKGSGLQNLNMNGFIIPNLQIENASNVTLGGGVQISNSLVLTAGKIQLNDYNLRLEALATLSGQDENKYAITNGQGKLFKNGVGNAGFTFPVGFSATTYNPVTIVQNGTVDDLGVRVLANVQKNGNSGPAFIKEVVDASWDIAEGTAGGSNLNITTNWKATDELPGFNRNKTGISLYDGIGWDLTNAMTIAATPAGSGYSITRSNVTNIGAFAVGYRPVLTTLLVSPKVFLQGPYVTGPLMNDGLRTAGVIPLTEPYSTLSNFVHSGSGGGEFIASSILAATGTPGNDIIDWVFAQLHNGSTGAVMGTRSVLLQRDGDVVDVDGTGAITPYLNFAGELPATYYVSIRHRNHLGARTNPSLSLARTTTTDYNFTTSPSQAFAGSVTTNAPLATLGSGLYGLWGGNANSDLTTRKSGSPTINDYSLLLSYLGPSLIISGVYQRTDFNLDGVVRKSGSPGINDYSKLLNILGSLIIINQPAF